MQLLEKYTKLAQNTLANFTSIKNLSYWKRNVLEVVGSSKRTFCYINSNNHERQSSLHLTSSYSTEDYL
jgi:hypothetical protein